MEIALIAFALLLLFGASRLPALGSSLGSAIRNFKKGFAEGTAEDDKPAGEKKLAQGDAQSVAADEKVGSKQG